MIKKILLKSGITVVQYIHKTGKVSVLDVYPTPPTSTKKTIRDRLMVVAKVTATITTILTVTYLTLQLTAYIIKHI